MKGTFGILLIGGGVVLFWLVLSDLVGRSASAGGPKSLDELLKAGGKKIPGASYAPSGTTLQPGTAPVQYAINNDGYIVQNSGARQQGQPYQAPYVSSNFTPTLSNRQMGQRYQAPYAGGPQPALKSTQPSIPQKPCWLGFIYC